MVIIFRTGTKSALAKQLTIEDCLTSCQSVFSMCITASKVVDLAKLLTVTSQLEKYGRWRALQSRGRGF